MLLKLLLFKILVRSRLEYAAAIWDYGHSTLVSDIEAVQNHDARFIFCNYHRTSSVSFMKTNFSLPLLSLHCKVARQSFCHKILLLQPYSKRNVSSFSPAYFCSPWRSTQIRISSMSYKRLQWLHHTQNVFQAEQPSRVFSVHTWSAQYCDNQSSLLVLTFTAHVLLCLYLILFLLNFALYLAPPLCNALVDLRVVK